MSRFTDIGGGARVSWDRNGSGINVNVVDAGHATNESGAFAQLFGAKMPGYKGCARTVFRDMDTSKMTDSEIESKLREARNDYKESFGQKDKEPILGAHDPQAAVNMGETFAAAARSVYKTMTVDPSGTVRL